jgi:hypothetical protein
MYRCWHVIADRLVRRFTPGGRAGEPRLRVDELAFQRGEEAPGHGAVAGSGRPGRRASMGALAHDERSRGTHAMTAGYERWHGPARAMALAVDAAVSAARAGDTAAFADAVAGLGGEDSEQLAVVLGTVLRDLLERSHPDGLDADDVHHLLRSCTRSAAGWYEPFDSSLLIQALTGALGITDPDESPHPDGMAVVAHGILLIADQLRVLAEELTPVLSNALRELMRAQTIELP